MLPEFIGPYRILAELGRGDPPSLYAAYDRFGGFPVAKEMTR